jgi:DNA polymerase-3 subunit epsilon
MKILWLDTETTGLTEAHGVVQIAGFIEICGEVRESFDLRCRPFSSDIVTDEALAVTGLTRESMERFDPAHSTYSRLVAMLAKWVDKYDKRDKFIFAGYNAQFDDKMMRAWFGKNDDRFWGSWVWFPPLDVMTLAMARLMGDRANLVNFKLGTVADHFGLKPAGDLHDALTDVQLTRDLYARLREGVRA